METYKLVKPMPPLTEACVVCRQSDGVNIPFNPANTDYQAYLKWLEEGNTPEPAEQGAE